MALKIRQLREESTDRVREILAETQDKLFKHKMRIATGEGVNPHEAREMRLDIARMKTLLRAIEFVSERAGVDEAAARTALQANSWGPRKAVAAIRAGAPAGS
ncbi:MAG: 50S ribosomal protein L29 [Planctomycetota bacterium]|jgi:ribosomal protein L29